MHADRTTGIAPPAVFAVIVLEEAPAWTGVSKFQGETGSIRTVAPVKRMAAAIFPAGGGVHFTAQEGVRHDTANRTFGAAKVVDWLLNQHR